MKTFAKLLQLAALLIVLGAMIGGSVYFRRENAKLRAQAGELRHRNDAVIRLGEENERTRELLARTKTDVNAAAEAMHADVTQLRAEVSQLEEHARMASAQKAAVAALIAANRDPEKGLVRLENFQNVGRATPVTAMQTLIWAVMKGDEPALEAAFSVTGDALEKAGEILAHLPEAERAKYPTPESIVALAFADQILRADALQVVPTMQLGSRAIVTVTVANSDDDAKVPMELAPDGWKVTVPKKFLVSLERKINPPPVSAPKK